MASESETSPAAQDEGALLAALRAGDESAYERFVREQGPRMLAVARRFVGQEADAHDVVQEAFTMAHRALDRFEGGSRLSTWLHRITVNAALMRLRSARRRPEVSIEALLPRFEEDEAAHHAAPVSVWRTTPEDEVLTEEARGLVRESIHALPDTHRDVLLLRDIEQLDTAETAAVLEISESAVKTRLHRARLALRGLLDPYFRTEDAS